MLYTVKWIFHSNNSTTKDFSLIKWLMIKALFSKYVYWLRFKNEDKCVDMQVLRADRSGCTSLWLICDRLNSWEDSSTYNLVYRIPTPIVLVLNSPLNILVRSVCLTRLKSGTTSCWTNRFLSKLIDGQNRYLQLSDCKWVNILLIDWFIMWFLTNLQLKF